MEKRTYLGIHISATAATAVCLDSPSPGGKALGCFTVSRPHNPDEASSPLEQVAGLVAEGCARRQWNTPEMFVALHCSMFMQHRVHSDFQDPRQIRQTVRFDTEETLASDISKLAVAYAARPENEGSELTVFTAEHQHLAELLSAFQSHGLDPITIEPDAMCLARFIESVLQPESELNCLYAVLAADNVYLVGLGPSLEGPRTRTFLVGAAQDAAALLSRQVPITAALFWPQEHLDKLLVLGFDRSLDCPRLSEQLGTDVEPVDLPDSLMSAPDDEDGPCGPAALAIACGAALARPAEMQTLNFRNDYMPYQGRRRRLEKAVKYLSASLTVLLVALGVYLTAQLLQVNGYSRKIRNYIQPQYSVAAMGYKMPAKMKDAVRRLDSIVKKLERSGGSSADENTLASRLALLLEAFNRCAKRTDLKLDKITVSDKFIHVIGDVANASSAIYLFDTVGEKLCITKSNHAQDGPRRRFNITIDPKGPKTIGRGKRR